MSQRSTPIPGTHAPIHLGRGEGVTSLPTQCPEPLLVSAAAAAELLGVSARTLWSLTHTGDMPFVRMGRRIMYSPESLRSWIASQEARNARGRTAAAPPARAS